MSMLRAVSSKTLASVYASFFFIGCVALFIGFLRYLCRAVARCNPRGASPKAVAAMLRGVVQEMWGAGTAVDPEVETRGGGGHGVGHSGGASSLDAAARL